MSEPKRTTKETHPHLPPGLILDKDGKVCKVCNSWQDFAGIKVYKKDPNAKGGSKAGAGLAGAMAAAGAGAAASGSSSDASSSGSSSSPGSTPATSASSSPAPQVKDRSECPPDTNALGRATWTFLHTTAAYYPDAPSQGQKTHMVNLLSSLPSLYPCSWCADDFGTAIKEHPPAPAAENKLALNDWLCKRHNEVNRKLGKPEFKCDWRSITRRWKDGPEDGSCD